MINLKGRTALVTGGSRGIGRAAAQLLADAGADIVISYLQDHRAAQSALEEVRKRGRKAITFPGNLSRREDTEALFKEARRVFGKIDIVVGNAGIWKRAPIEQMSSAEWQETVDFNLTSIYLTCQLAAREMKPRKAGRIILVSSTAGQRGEAYYSHYAASKGGIIALTKSLASELGPFGILVNCVAPGWVDTDMSAEAVQNPEKRAKIEKITPTGRVASPEDIAGPILFLASELSNQVQGEILNVNGGSVLCG